MKMVLLLSCNSWQESSEILNYSSYLCNNVFFSVSLDFRKFKNLKGHHWLSLEPVWHWLMTSANLTLQYWKDQNEIRCKQLRCIAESLIMAAYSMRSNNVWLFATGNTHHKQNLSLSAWNGWKLIQSDTAARQPSCCFPLWVNAEMRWETPPCECKCL